MSRIYPFSSVESYWQDFWDKNKTFKASDKSDKKKYYVLEMFPYPSGRIHVGHVRNYTLGDVVARFKLAQGYNVLHPMGWDAFGLPAENAAIEHGVHPKEWTLENIKVMKSQLKRIGLSYDWDRELTTCLPDYFGKEQKIFLDFLKNGLAYRKESLVNWDPVENTVLANEQVIDGKGWRSGAQVEKKRLAQWFLKITDYAEELLEGLEDLKDWPDRVRIMQSNWIGKSYGANIHFKLDQKLTGFETIEVYSTHPETLYGASFVGLSPNHPLAEVIAEKNPDAAAFIKECQAGGTSEAEIEKAEKKGFNTGLTVVHPFDAEWKIPVYIANFVLMDYGTGAIFACPAHDQRDYEFARKYGLPIIPVKEPCNDCLPEDKAFEGEGRMVHSAFLNGLDSREAIDKAIEHLEKLGAGERQTNFRIRDWGVSRQRYWGCPIPIIHCQSCGSVPVPESQLPILPPEDISFDKPGNPIAHHPTWKYVTCPVCGEKAERETDTFDTFFESSWYFARFCAPHAEQPIDKQAVDAWLPVDQYIGGIEHAVMHLLYARFFTRALAKCGYTDVKEPFNALMTQGMVCHRTFKDHKGQWVYPDDVRFEGEKAVKISDGSALKVGRSEKMSKSKKNVVDPQVILQEYGADTARLFMMSDSPPDRDLEWTDAGLQGAWRYLNRLWRLVQHTTEQLEFAGDGLADANKDMQIKVHRTIDGCTSDIERFAFNKYVARVRELTNDFEKSLTVLGVNVLREAIESIVQLLNPVVPHITEEMWKKLGYQDSLVRHPWPVADKALLVAETIKMAVQVNGKLRATIDVDVQLSKDRLEELALTHENVQRSIGDKEVRKIIIVPRRIINVVI